MKRLLMTLVMSAVVLGAAAQDRKSGEKFQIEAGYGIFSNSLNVDHFQVNKDPYAYNGDVKMQGVNVKFTMPSKWKYLDFVFGATYMKSPSMRESITVDNVTKTREYVLNGGGIYVGVSPKWKTEHFGLTSELSLGFFPFREINTLAINNLADSGKNYNNQLLRSTVFGGIASAGFYVKFGRFGINPTLNLMLASEDTTYVFYGLTIPLTISF
jgi:hypothetical protein